MIDYTAPRFNDPDAARDYLESVRWPDGAACVHCGGCEHIYRIEPNEKKKIRPGLYKCGDCGEQFTVTVKTVFERSKIPLHKWVLATTLMCQSKKGISSHQLHRMLGVTYKTAWFMSHRIREAMRQDGGLLGGGGKTVEADETYVGGKPRKNKPSKKGRGTRKTPVVALVERGGRGSMPVRSPALPRRRSGTP